jgi:paraquat-inducible protein A
MPDPSDHDHDIRNLRECPDCGCFSRLPALRPGMDARCPRCDGVLRRRRRRPLDTALACATAGLLFYVLAVTAPFLEVHLSGRARVSTLNTGPAALEQQGLGLLGLAVLACTVIAPLCKLAVALTVLLGLRAPNPPRWLHVPFRWMERLSPWSMVEVYLLGLFVAYTRLVALAQVQIGVAAYALVGLMLSMVALDSALDPEAVWENLERRGVAAWPPQPVLDAAPRPGAATRLIGCHVCHRVNRAAPGAPCSRCGAALHPRKAGSLARTAALTAAAMVLYIPANTYIVMNVTRLGRPNPYTILGGAQELLDAGLWPLALLVFFASITVPVLKLVGLTLMLVTTGRGSRWRLVDRTRLYRVIDVIGRWSMIDVFMISILVSLVQFGQLANVTSDIGAVAFAGVVVLTMLAAEGFDPRLMWDAAAARRHAPKPRRPASQPASPQPAEGAA